MPGEKKLKQHEFLILTFFLVTHTDLFHFRLKYQNCGEENNKLPR